MKSFKAHRWANESIVIGICLCSNASLALNESGPATNDAAPARLPEVKVQGASELREGLPIGNYHQPEWTARRRFATTRVYVQPEWQVEGEVGLDLTSPREGRPQYRIQEEIEIGLPHRFQLDLENADSNFEGNDDERRWHHVSNSIELGYALADWGRIPLNPTVKLEWKISSESEQDTRNRPETKFLVGPSFQWRPTKRTHVDVVPLAGLGHESPYAEAFVFFGIEFSPGSREREAVEPASLRGK